MPQKVQFTRNKQALQQQTSIVNRRYLPVVIFKPAAILCSFDFGCSEAERKGILDFFCKIPNPSAFALWIMGFTTEVCSGTCHPSHAMIWISKIDSAKSIEDVRTSRSILVADENSLKKILLASDVR